ALDDKLGYPLMIISKDEYLTHSVPRKLSGGGVIDLTGDEDPTDEDEDAEMDDSTRVLASLGGEISSGEKKFRELNIGDCDNTGDGSKTAGRAIITWGGEITLYACMASIYGSSCKVSRRTLMA
nr:hypothetical protein [Tanacetum cinerariifolium]